MLQKHKTQFKLIMKYSTRLKPKPKNKSFKTQNNNLRQKKRRSKLLY